MDLPSFFFGIGIGCLATIVALFTFCEFDNGDGYPGDDE